METRAVLTGLGRFLDYKWALKRRVELARDGELTDDHWTLEGARLKGEDAGGEREQACYEGTEEGRRLRKGGGGYYSIIEQLLSAEMVACRHARVKMELELWNWEHVPMKMKMAKVSYSFLSMSTTRFFDRSGHFQSGWALAHLRLQILLPTEASADTAPLPYPRLFPWRRNLIKSTCLDPGKRGYT